MMLLTINWANALNVIGFSFLMVFVLLLLIVFVLNIFGKIFSAIDKDSQNQVKNDANSAIISGTENVENQISDNDIAAISMALYLYYADMHDEESNVITIKKVNRRYSPWSSKIFGLNTLVK